MGRLLGIIGLLGCAIAGSACGTRDAARPPPQRPVLGAASETPALLATIVDEQALASGSGLGMHPSAAPASPELFFSERGGGVAWVVEKAGAFHVIHNGRAGKPYAAVGAIALSPDGRRCAYGALAGGEWRMVVDGEEGARFSAVKLPVFSLDGVHVAYQAMAGERWHLVVDATPNAGTRTRYLGHEFSADGSRIAFIDDVGDDDRGRLMVSDLAFKSQVTVATGVSGVVVSADRTRAAAAATAGRQQGVVAFDFARPSLVERGPLYDSIQSLVLSRDGEAFAYLAERHGRRFAVMNGSEEPLPLGDVIGEPVLRPDGKGVGVLLALDGNVLFQELFIDGARGGRGYEEAEGLVYSDHDASHAYAARKGSSWLVVVNGKEGPPFDRVVTPQFSPDGKHLVFRARKDGRRFVVVADASGRTLRQHPAYEQVFPVRFTADGKSVAYGVKAGSQLLWKVEPL